MFLSYLIDDNFGLSWPNNAVRNWQEFGFLKLHGRLVPNPGGYDAIEHPESYNGMSPFSLYPVFFAAKIFGWTGLGTQAFHVLLLAAVFWGIWKLLGRDDLAMLVAAAAVLCPGYLRWPKILDPNTLAILPAIPYAAIVAGILKKPEFTTADGTMILILTLMLASLNWSVAWICGPCIFLFLGTPGLSRRGFIFLLASMAVVVPVIAIVSMASKFGLMHPGSSASASALAGNPAEGGPVSAGVTKLIERIGGYTWANAGYGVGLTTGRAFVRLAFVNGVGLFPLWLVFLHAVTRRIRTGQTLSWLMFIPLALTMADIVVMRNYFAHHPWMSSPVLLVGIIFSLALVRAPHCAETTKADRVPFKIAMTVAVLCFAYGSVVLACFRANEMDTLMLVRLVRQHTTRSEAIVILKKSDPKTAGLAGRLEEPLDRRIIVADDLKDLAAEKDHDVILSAVQLNGSLRLIAQSTAHSRFRLSGLVAWFDRTIARRRPGDRLDPPGTYFLYAPD